MIFYYCLLFPWFKPEVPGNFAVMLVNLAVSLLPIVIFARLNLQPFYKHFNGETCGFCLMPLEIDDAVECIVKHPGSFQISPRSFLALRAPPSIQKALGSFGGVSAPALEAWLLLAF